MRLPVNQTVALSILIAAGAYGLAFAKEAAPPASTGPAADYPVVVGEPYKVEGTTWTPADQLNYDAVGYATVYADGLSGLSGAHKTLPLPSYVEVTSLGTGRTIVVRLVQRGPMDNQTLIGLSPTAAAQLGIEPADRAAVRIRRVNPPEVERAQLRSGLRAPERMDTPEPLLKVLRRKLAEQSPLLPPPSTPPAMPTSAPVAEVPARPVAKPSTKAPSLAFVDAALEPSAAPSQPASAIKTKSTASAKAPVPAAAPPVRAGKGDTVVQVAAFSAQDRAQRVAAQLGGSVSRAGSYWRVRLGPFSRGEATAALEKAKAAGYSDARIQRAD